MSSLALKIIALTTMIIDHYGAIFQSSELIFRIIGRLAFPIYCFLIVEGYFHTKDIKKYASKLLIFALISEVPFDYAFFGKLNWSHQNIFFTLFIGLVAINLLEKYKTDNHFTSLSIILGAGTLATLLNTDYSFIGIIYILIFYKTKDFNSVKRMLLVGAVMFITNYLSTSFIQQYSLLALPILLLYNGKLGLKVKALQMFFYIAYPLHLAIFALINLSR
ncbi:MAG: TraX family protein [Gudongella sp.]|nr:TraX family protein [Gudongella sp.]